MILLFVRLFLRHMDGDSTDAVENSDGAYAPFFSPDGREVGFSAEGHLWRVSVAGGMPFRITASDGAQTGTSAGDGDTQRLSTADAEDLKFELRWHELST